MSRVGFQPVLAAAEKPANYNLPVYAPDYEDEVQCFLLGLCEYFNSLRPSKPVRQFILRIDRLLSVAQSRRSAV